ncbi:glycosyltransferase family 4 protein [Caulobacter sp. 17J65-9]|uniref:glycosyltransferase n=1 Tax=Caulobacter sp. 17J65-9 TaxID=2709382 RepID=UPI0013D1FD45
MRADPARRRIVFVGADPAYLYAFRRPVMRGFVEHGWQVTAVAPEQAGFDTAVFQNDGVRFVRWDIAKAALNPFQELRAFVSLVAILRAERPDVLFAHTIKSVIYGMLAGALAGVPRRTAMIPGLGYAFLPGRGLKRALVGFVARAGYRAALARAHLAIFQNRDDVATFRGLRLLGPRTEVGLVDGSGVDLTRFTPAAFPDGPPTFLMVARLLRDKGVYEFVEAARLAKQRLPEARFVLVGAADSNPAAVPQAQVDAWVAEGLIEARGHLADPREAFAAAHVFVLPSYREGTPRTNLEAMATGRAVLTTDVPGCRETVTHGHNGLLVPVRDPQALAEAMVELASDLERAEAMGRAGRKLCEDRYDVRTVSRATVRLLEGADEAAELRKSA